MTANFIHPSLLLILGAMALPLIRESWRKTVLVAVPLLVFFDVLHINGSHGIYGSVSFMGEWTLVFGRVDALSAIFGFIMALMCIIGTIYSLHWCIPSAACCCCSVLCCAIRRWAI